MSATTVLQRCLSPALDPMHALRRQTLLLSVESLLAGRRLIKRGRRQLRALDYLRPLIPVTYSPTGTAHARGPRPGQGSHQPEKRGHCATTASAPSTTW